MTHKATKRPPVPMRTQPWYTTFPAPQRLGASDAFKLPSLVIGVRHYPPSRPVPHPDCEVQHD